MGCCCLASGMVGAFNDRRGRSLMFKERHGLMMRRQQFCDIVEFLGISSLFQKLLPMMPDSTPYREYMTPVLLSIFAAVTGVRCSSSR